MKQAKKTDYRNVTLTGGFWKKKEDLNRDVTIDAVYDRFTESGRIDAFKCDWKEGMPDMPHIFWDSDVAKWIEGVAYLTETKREPELEALVDATVDEIEKNRIGCALDFAKTELENSSKLHEEESEKLSIVEILLAIILIILILLLVLYVIYLFRLSGDYSGFIEALMGLVQNPGEFITNVLN